MAGATRRAIPKMPMALPNCVLGTMRKIMAMVVGMIIPPPTAWMTRARIREFMLHARLQNSDPTTNTAMDSDVQALESDPVPEPSREGNHHAEGEHVDRVHPLHLRGADVEHVHDRRDGHVHDARVQDGHEGADQRHQHRRDPVGHRPLAHLFPVGGGHGGAGYLRAWPGAGLLAHCTLSSCSRQRRTLARSPASRLRVSDGRL